MAEVYVDILTRSSLKSCISPFPNLILVQSRFPALKGKFRKGTTTGRSGLVASTGPRKSSSGADMRMLHLRMAQAACNCLNDDILPELARAVRCIIVQAGPSIEIRNGARSRIGIP